MCKIIDSEMILKFYFKKYPGRKVIKYQKLKEIRYKAEPVMNVYIDITYSSLRDVKYAYPDSVSIESDRIRIIGSTLTQLPITEISLYEQLKSFL